MEYGKLIKRALQITWQNKALWILGILAAMFGGQVGSSGSGLRYTFNQTDLTNLGSRWERLIRQGNWNWLRFPSAWVRSWQTLGGVAVAALIVIIGLMLIAGVLSIVIRYPSLGGMIGAVDDVERGQKVTFRTSFGRAWPRLLRLFAIDILLGLGVFAAALLLAIAATIGGLIAAAPLMIIRGGHGALTAFGILWAALVGFVLVVAAIAAIVALCAAFRVVREYALRICMLQLKRAGESVRAGYALFRARFRESLVTWLVLAGIDLALSILAVPFSLVGAAGVLLPTLAIRGLADARPAAYVATLIPVVLFTSLVALFFGGVYLAFKSTVWTLAFREVVEPTTTGAVAVSSAPSTPETPSTPDVLSP